MATGAAAPAEISVRDRLVRAAAEVIDEVGEDQLTLSQVVRRAGLSTGAVYSNFANREELVVAVYLEAYVDRMWEGVDGLAALLASDRRGEDFLAGLAELVVRPDDPRFHTSRWLRVRAIAASQRYDHVHTAVTDIQHQVAQRIVEIVTDAQARGDADPARDPRSIALLLQQFGFGLLLHDLSGELAPDADEWVVLVRDLVAPLFPGRL